jgi:hypothetical protein
LLDEQTGAVEPYVLEASGEPATPPNLTSDDQLTYWVLRHQRLRVFDIRLPPLRESACCAHAKATSRRPPDGAACHGRSCTYGFADIISSERYIFWLAGGTRPFKRRYTAICP